MRAFLIWYCVGALSILVIAEHHHTRCGHAMNADGNKWFMPAAMVLATLGPLLPALIASKTSSECK